MVKVKIFKNAEGFVKRFYVEGHSDYAKHGSDIVCSAVSALTQTAVIGLKEIAGADIRYKMEPGFLECEIITVNDSDRIIKTNAILDTMVIGLNNIKKNYTAYISMVIKEEV